MSKTPVFEYQEKGHKYFLDGKPMTGVTTILGVINKPALLDWSAREATEALMKVLDEKFEEQWKTGASNVLIYKPSELVTPEEIKKAKNSYAQKRDSAASKGTDVHKLCEMYILSQMNGTPVPPLPEDPQARKQVENFIQWATENKVKFLAAEKKVYDASFFYAGTLDFLCEIDSMVYVGDVKTGGGIWPEMWLQTSAYQNALEKLEPDIKVGGHIIVNIRKNGETEVQKSFFYKENLEAFLAALALYRGLNARNS